MTQNMRDQFNKELECMKSFQRDLKYIKYMGTKSNQYEDRISEEWHRDIFKDQLLRDTLIYKMRVWKKWIGIAAK